MAGGGAGLCRHPTTSTPLPPPPPLSQVPNADFFLKTVPLLDGGGDVGMVLSPQAFYNLNAAGDIFNHANVHFWDYTQPGYDALGLISCTGTNFLVRARAFKQVGVGVGEGSAAHEARRQRWWSAGEGRCRAGKPWTHLNPSLRPHRPVLLTTPLCRPIGFQNGR